MAKEMQATEAKSNRKNPAVVEPATAGELGYELAGLSKLPAGLNGGGNGSIQAQAALLTDPRLQTVQRCALAAQLGWAQGNRHLQRVIAHPTQHVPDGDAEIGFLTSQEDLFLHRVPGWEDNQAGSEEFALAAARYQSPQGAIQRDPDGGGVPPGVTHSRSGSVVSITAPREHAGSSRTAANVIDAVLESAYVASGRHLATNLRFMSQLAAYLATIPTDQPQIRFEIRLVREGGRVSRIQFADVEMEVEEGETVSAEAPRRRAPSTAPEPQPERRPGEWVIEANRLYPGFAIRAFLPPGGGAGSGMATTADIETYQMDSVGVGWCTFIREYAGGVVEFAQIDAVSSAGLRVTWLRYQNGRVTRMGSDARHPRTLDRMEIGTRLSLERLQTLRVWQPIMVGVAWGTAAVLAIGFGPGATMLGEGSALAGEGWVANALAGGMGGALSQFIRECADAMMSSSDPAHFYEGADWAGIGRRVAIAAVTNAFGAGVGTMVLSGGGSQLAQQLTQFAVVAGGRIVVNTVAAVANALYEDMGRDAAIRALQTRYRSASGEERERIHQQLQAKIRQDQSTWPGVWRDIIADIINQCLSSLPE